MLRISVVEDKDVVRKRLVDKIDRTEGMRCVSDFAHPQQALEMIPKQKPDLVIMDIGLPKMDGIECMIRIQMQNQAIHFLMFTIFDHEEKLFDALKAGARGYILKKDGPAGVIRAVNDYQAGGAPMSREIARKVLASFVVPAPKNIVEAAKLTKQELKILELVAKGYLNKEIANLLNIKEGTVKQHNYNIFNKLEVNNRTEATAKYLESKKDEEKL